LAFLKRADRRCFGTLWANLENQFSRGNNQYPINLTAAYSLLVNFKPPKREEPRCNTRSQEAAVEEEDGMTFVQSGKVVAGSRTPASLVSVASTKDTTLTSAPTAPTPLSSKLKPLPP